MRVKNGFLLCYVNRREKMWIGHMSFANPSKPCTQHSTELNTMKDNMIIVHMKTRKPGPFYHVCD